MSLPVKARSLAALVTRATASVTVSAATHLAKACGFQTGIGD